MHIYGGSGVLCPRFKTDYLKCHRPAKDLSFYFNNSLSDHVSKNLTCWESTPCTKMEKFLLLDLKWTPLFKPANLHLFHPKPYLLHVLIQIKGVNKIWPYIVLDILFWLILAFWSLFYILIVNLANLWILKSRDWICEGPRQIFLQTWDLSCKLGLEENVKSGACICVIVGVAILPSFKLELWKAESMTSHPC